MTCDEARIGLYALLDGELDVAKNVEVLGHLEACPSCKQECELDARLKSLVRQEARRLTVAPADLWPAITAAIRHVVAARAAARRLRLWPRIRRLQAGWAAVALVLVALSVAYLRWPPPPPFVAEEIVMDHVGSVRRPEGPVDIPSADPAVVADWIGQAVPFVARVPNLTAAGGRLLGPASATSARRAAFASHTCWGRITRCPSTKGSHGVLLPAGADRPGILPEPRREGLRRSCQPPA